jgi:hypothetical protein
MMFANTKKQMPYGHSMFFTIYVIRYWLSTRFLTLLMWKSLFQTPPILKNENDNVSMHHQMQIKLKKVFLNVDKDMLLLLLAMEVIVAIKRIES